MKTNFPTVARRGFTLMELMVAMAITLIIITVLVSITAIATDTWNRSRAELRAARQAKAMVNVMAKDFECLVTRRGGTSEWFSAVSTTEKASDTKVSAANASDLFFFSGAMDRYNGNIGGASDKGGDVSGIAYRLDLKDPIDKNGTIFKKFVFKRLLVDPDKTFTDLLGKDDLTVAFSSYLPTLEGVDNFVCENIYQFSVTFLVEAQSVSTKRLVTTPVIIGKSVSGPVADKFKLKGTGIETTATPTGLTPDELKSGRISAVEVSITVLSDAGMDQLRTRNFKSDADRAKFLQKNSFNYSKRVQVPSM